MGAYTVETSNRNVRESRFYHIIHNGIITLNRIKARLDGTFLGMRAECIYRRRTSSLRHVEQNRVQI